MSEGSGLTARDQQELEEFMRQAFFENAIIHGELAEVQLLSSEGARRITHRGESAEQLATQLGHHEVAAWLRATHNWTELHHVEFLPPERTREMLRGGGDIHAEVKPFGVTPLSIAQDLAAAARPVIHSAFLVLEAAKPWSRETHHLFPAAARARAEELWPTGFRLSRQLPEEEQHTMYEHVWMTIVMPREVTRDYTPPPAPFAARRARLEAAEAKAFTAAAEAAREATGADAAASGAGSRSTRRRARRRSRGTRPEGGEWCVL